MRTTILIIVLCICALGAGSGCSTTSPTYGRWEKYSTESALQLPDFELYYMGTAPGAHVRIGSTMRWGIVYKFEAKKGDERVPLTWSSGLGDIGPTSFEIGGRNYFLEMVRSDFLSDQAPDDTVALWPEEDWESRRNPWWRIW